MTLKRNLRVDRCGSEELKFVPPEKLARLESAVESLAGEMTKWRRTGANHVSFTLESLEMQRRWVAWRDEDKAGMPAINSRCNDPKEKPKKVPRNPRNRARARSNDASTWGTRAEADAAARSLLTKPGTRGGVGIQLGPILDGKMYLCGIDLDSCRDAETGELTADASAVLKAFCSYAEVSPSGEGVKILFLLDQNDFAFAQAMARAGSGRGSRKSWSRGSHDEIAIDLEARYYAVTGQREGAAPDEILPVDRAHLNWLFDVAGPEFVRSKRSPEGISVDRENTTDRSGSAFGLRFLMDQARDGKPFEEASQALFEDGGPAGEWARRVDERQIDRAWQKANQIENERRRDLDAVFDCHDEISTDGSRAHPIVEKLNSRHAHIMINGKARICTVRSDGTLTFGSVQDLHSQYSNDRIMLGKKLVPVSVYWMLNSKRRSYPNGLSFAFADVPPGTFNQWTGWAVAPDAGGSCKLILQHIQHVICAGDVRLYRYLLGWLAHLVQRPEEKPGVALVIRGPKGAGKDTLAEYLVRIVGRNHAPTVADSTHLIGRFNARLELALLLQVQEGFWAGDKKAEGVLKYLVTSETLEIERKGIDSYSAPNVTRIIITANAEWVVPASSDERRWAFFEASGRRRNDRSYFDALYAEMNGTGPAALLAYLLDYDISEFDVRSAPPSVGLAEQKIQSLRNLEAWWFECLSSGQVYNHDESPWCSSPMTIGRQELYAAYSQWVQSRRFHGDPRTFQEFGKELKRLIPTIQNKRPTKLDGTRPREYIIPTLAECRVAFETQLGQTLIWDD